MTNDLRAHPWRFVLLTLLLAGVWGYNAQQVARGVQPAAVVLPTPPRAVDTAAAPYAADPPRRPYRANYRDPFRAPASTLSSRALPVKDPPVPPPAVRLVGIVGTTAILHTPAGEVLLKAGQASGGFTVRSVSADEVVIEYRGRKTVLRAAS